MSYPVLARQDTALDDAETVALLRGRLGDGLRADVVEYGELTLEIAPDAWHAAVATCRDDERLAFDLFDCLFGVDAGEDGLDVVAVLYSTSKGRRVLLRTRCDGGREAPSLATLTDLYPGANWHERETFDMFGIEFPGHPGLLPRILCIENFEGWPLRKEFPLASRVAKPWPGVKDPAEPDEDGNVVVREPAVGEAPGPSGLDELIAKQAREANPTAQDQVAADEGTSGGAAAANAASEEPEREEVSLDQETYDRLIADGKSERIARSKAKAAFIKKQRAAEREAAEAGESEDDAEPTDSTADEPAATSDATDGVADGDAAPESPDAPPGAGTAGRTADEAAPPTSDDGASDAIDDDDDDATATVDDDGSDATATADGVDDQPTVDTDAAAAATATAEAARRDQAAAREARAAEDASAADDGGQSDVDPIPAGTPPPDPDAPEEEDGRSDDVDTSHGDEHVAGSDDDSPVDPSPRAHGGAGPDETDDAQVTDAAEGTDDAAQDDADAETTDAAEVTDQAAEDDADTADDAAAHDAAAADEESVDPEPSEEPTESTTDETGPDDPVASDGSTDEAHADTADDEPTDADDEPVEDGPYGPGSAMPRADGSGPDGWSIKATTTGNVFHTTDSPNWRTAQADAWFADAEAARAAGFEHWDPYVRTDLDAEDVDSTPEDAGEDGAPADDSDTDLPEGAGTDFVEAEDAGEPGPVGGTLERDDGPENPQRTDEEPAGYGALDTHDREPVDDVPATDEAADADADAGQSGDADDADDAGQSDDAGDGETSEGDGS